MKWRPKNSVQALKLLAKYGRAHRSLLASGVLWTIGVVLFRLAMPWPLRGVVELVFPDGSGEGSLLAPLFAAAGEPLPWLVGAYVVCALGVGLTEMAQRVHMMRFSAQTVHDVRTAVVRNVSRTALRQYGTGDLTARLVGDTGRLKAGMSGILVHVTQNGLLFGGICAVFLFIAPRLGIFFLAAGVLVVLLGVRAAAPVAASAHRHRRMEADYATSLEELLADDGLDPDLEDLNIGSSEKDVKTTRLVMHSTFVAHGILAVTVGLALWVGARAVTAGVLAPGDIFLFIAYALIVHRRLVQVGRQLARSGKVLAAANRLDALLADAPQDREAEPKLALPTRLERELRLEAVRLRSARSKADPPRLKRTDLTIRAGERIAVVGGVAAGKSSLLRVIAGVEPPDGGRVVWDDTELTGNGTPHRTRVGYIGDSPVIPQQPLWKTLRLSGPSALAPEEQRTLAEIGVWPMLHRLPKGLSTKAGSKDLSRNQARLIKLGGVLLHDSSGLWVLDGPLEGLGKKAARRCLDAIIARAAERAVIVSVARNAPLDRFDRVIGLRRGAIVYDGDASGWKDRKVAPRMEAAACRP